MEKTPRILVFGLPEQEKLLLQGSLHASPELLEQFGIYRNLAQLITGPNFMPLQARRGVLLVVLDRSYDIPQKKVARPFVLTGFEAQFNCVRQWFPGAQVLCTTNSPIYFAQENYDFDAPHFLGVAPYVALHHNLHFGPEGEK